MRTFIALIPSKKSIKTIEAFQEKIPFKKRDAQTPLEKLHLTLIFCGDIDTAHVKNLAHLLMTMELVSRFSLEPEHLAVFGYDHTKRLVLTFKRTPIIDAIYMITMHEISRSKIPLDTSRPFAPHISLAKINTRPKVSADIKLPDIEFSELVLFQSILSRTGSRFQPIAKIQLR